MENTKDLQETENQICIYCAGPLFNRSERDEMTAIADSLCEFGYSVYLPHRDGMEFRLILEKLIERQFNTAEAAAFLHAAIFSLDIYQLTMKCDALVWNLNGRVPDEGAVAEAAIAWTLGKPIIAYKEDVRSLITGRDNPLLVGMVDFETIQEISALPELLSRKIVEHEPSDNNPSRWPLKIKQAALRGEELWNLIQQTQSESINQQNEVISECVIELFASSNVTAN